MGNLRVETHIVGEIQENCHFAIHTDTKELLIIDPGDEAKRLAEYVKNGGYRPVAILLTHGHFDHIMAMEELAKQFDIPVYAHEEEQEILEDKHKNLTKMFLPSEEGGVYHADIYVKDGQELSLAGFTVRVLHTPGHTKGSCCYYLPQEDTVFSGDTLFCQSVGRTDFPTGSGRQLRDSIREKLMTLPEHTAVYAGHMDATTIGDEKKFNFMI